MNQVILLTFLHLIGILVGLPFRRVLPIPFIALSGFLWGMLLWVGSVLLWLGLTGERVIPGAVITFGVASTAIIVVNLWQQSWRLKRNDGLWCAGALLTFAVVGLIASGWNYSFGSPDSASQIIWATMLASDGLTDWTIAQFLEWGVGLAFLHIPSHYAGEEYLYMLQPLTGYTFIVVWIYLMQRSLRLIRLHPHSIALLTGLLALLLFGSRGMIFQFFYIHNTLHSAVYLFVAVATLWIGIQEDNRAWLVFSTVAMTGFGLFRLEAPLVAIIYLAILMSFEVVSRRDRIWVSLIPISTFLLLAVWVWARTNTLISSYAFYVLLTPEAMLLRLAVLALFVGFVIACWQNVKFVSLLLPHLDKLMLGILAGGMLFGFFWKPDFMEQSINAILHHLLLTDWWSGLVITLIIILIVCARRNRIPYSALFTYSVPAFLMLALLSRMHSIPYHIGSTDSFNRMLTYILPVTLMYGGLKLASLFEVNKSTLGGDLVSKQTSVELQQ